MFKSRRAFAQVAIGVLIAASLLTFGTQLDNSDIASAATCVRAAVPTDFNSLKLCQDWSTKTDSDSSIFRAHKVGVTSTYTPVTSPLQTQLSVYQNTSKPSSTCYLAISVKFKWNGVPGSKTPTAVTPTLWRQPDLETKGLPDAIAVELKSSLLGWDWSVLQASTMTGKNGLTGTTENWSLNSANRPDSDKPFYRRLGDLTQSDSTTYYNTSATMNADGYSRGAIKVGAPVDLGQSGLTAVYTSTVTFRESHNRGNGPDLDPGLAATWFTSEGEFVWTATNTNAGCKTLTLRSIYQRNETIKRDAGHYCLPTTSELLLNAMSFITPASKVGSAIYNVALIGIGEAAGRSKSEADSCRTDKYESFKSSYSTVIW